MFPVKNVPREKCSPEKVPGKNVPGEKFPEKGSRKKYPAGRDKIAEFFRDFLLKKTIAFRRDLCYTITRCDYFRE